MAKKKKKNDALPDLFGSVLSKTPTNDSKSINAESSTKSSPVSASSSKKKKKFKSLSNKSKQNPSITAHEKDNQIFDSSSMREINIDSRSWESMLADTNSWKWLPYSHGMELELVICDKDGHYLEGEQIVFILKELVTDATKAMKAIIKNEHNAFPPMPEYIRSKIKKLPYNRTDKEKGFLMCFDYEINNSNLNKVIPVDSFGRDGNVTMSTIILELVTPPCQYAEELAYWASTLFNLAKTVLPKGKNALFIMSTALNPTVKEYTAGLSHGDHHHIGSFYDDREKVQCYDMVRNFLPHLIALSVNSPMINMAPTDSIKSKLIDGKPRYTAPKCIRSIRLQNNTTMLSNSADSAKYLPYLATGDQSDKDLLLKTLEKASIEDARFQDVYPFTKYGTVEVRVMDAQLSIARRIGLALLLETMFYKARKLYYGGKWVPNVNSETICFNRRMAIERGMIGLFKGVNSDNQQLAAQGDQFFADCYFGTQDKPHRFMFQAVQQMFHYLKEDLIELGYLDSPFMKPLLQSVFGDISYAQTPMTEAEYQLCLYDWKVKQNEIPDIVNTLIYYTGEYSKDPLQQPLTGNLNLPNYML
ncbi:hypothetical protein [Candidatus Lokiarchaeum ossiferum]|uniref:hypothetical protein n=1 Tax=Candidatus Lokiarchaeum ossiferum TaxID=2951803 RepID=UPI00352E51F9